MSDMLVKLYDLPEENPVLGEEREYRVLRAMAPDRLRIVEWVRARSGPCAAGECEASFANRPVSCYIAVEDNRILGYACYDATAPDFFGPTRVDEKERGRGIGRALLLTCMYAMREKGYAYAVIGGVGPQQFYEKCVGAVLIPDSKPGIYRDFIGREENI